MIKTSQKSNIVDFDPSYTAIQGLTSEAVNRDNTKDVVCILHYILYTIQYTLYLVFRLNPGQNPTRQRGHNINCNKIYTIKCDRKKCNDVKILIPAIPSPLALTLTHTIAIFHNPQFAIFSISILWHFVRTPDTVSILWN